MLTNEETAIRHITYCHWCTIFHLHRFLFKAEVYPSKENNIFIRTPA